MLAARRLKLLRDVADRTADAKTIRAACTATADALDGHALEVPFVLMYLVDPRGAHADLVAATGLIPASEAAPRTIDLIQRTMPHGRSLWPRVRASRWMFLSSKADSGNSVAARTPNRPIARSSCHWPPALSSIRWVSWWQASAPVGP
jgi:hypothetical protein